MNLSKNIIKNAAYIITVTALLVFVNGSVSAEEDYTIKGDEIIFSQQKAEMIVSGNAVFSSEEFSILSERLKVDSEKKLIISPVKVVLISGSQKVTGESMEYNYEEEKGTIYGAESSLGELNFGSKKLNITAVSPLELNMTDGEFTPCIREKPHYHFKAKEIRVHPDKTITLHHIVTYIGKVPAFYLPYYAAEYNYSEDGEGEFKDAMPIPQIGYESGKGMTVEFSYPYQTSEKNSGNIYYWQAGDDEDTREFINKYQITDNLSWQNRYKYLYIYDSDDEEVDEHDEEFFSTLNYRKNSLSISGGIGEDLLADERRYLLTYSQTYLPGLRGRMRQEYNEDGLVKELYVLNSSMHKIRWNLKYVDGEDYNYYPFLDLYFPTLVKGITTSVGFGEVENGGVRLNKQVGRINMNYSYKLIGNLRYHLRHNYRFHNYEGDYENYHIFNLYTGFTHSRKFKNRMRLNTRLFFDKMEVSGTSPLPDDREDEETFIRPGMTLNIPSDLPQSSWQLSADAAYKIETEKWDEITAKITKVEDCFKFFVGYEFIDGNYLFGIEI
ncbi:MULTISPECIES: LPS export ABC transporter periplasmic protein LptC [unclassified Halanaerobium]|uniref:LPS export ABC transporter periplasmic protein LptC n=1 Tax=unclassified Halanaerobium TaxID=2641197 RepID=UPI000DF47914|nr:MULTISPECIES: LPS export ABC transporter periplasmic protein LptC [unclassified Halanaerobium]RCW43830.1 LPS-assembly protein [Halanaerobium sp. MA284_MarDTE_T2]RCW80531.1 LPS-assembly protein [Halanaerobium sp. DL-01]